MSSDEIIFGSPDFHKKVRAEFPRFFEVLPRLVAALNDLTTRAFEKPEPHQRVILNLGLLTGVTLVEVVTLVGNGLGQGAMKIARTLMETVVTAEYLRQTPTELDAYLGWAWIEKHKDFEFLKANLAYLLPTLTKDEVDTLEREFAKVRPMFARPDGSLRQSWCRLNLADRATKVGLADVYRRLNPLSSAFIHGTVSGLVRHFEPKDDIDRIAIPPSLRYCDLALITGQHLTGFMVETLAKTFGWDDPKESLLKDFNYAWPEPKAVDRAGHESL